MPALFAGSLLAAPESATAQAATETLEVEVTATVPARCGFTGAAQAPQARDIESAGRLEIALQLDCNTPFAVGVTATHGGLQNQTHADDQAGFAFRKSYGVSLAIDTDAGGVTSARCDAAQLLPGGSCAYQAEDYGRGLSSGEGVAIDRPMRMIIDWSDQSSSSNRLAAGSYQDTLRVVIGARV